LELVMTILIPRRSTAIFCMLALIMAMPCAAGPRAGWEKKDVKMRLAGGRSIEAVYYPAGHAPRMMKDRRQPLGHSKKFRYPLGLSSSPTSLLEPVTMGIIDSPPIDGFVPYVAVTVTDERSDELYWFAYPEPAVIGTYLTASPQTDYAIGIVDTGASTTLLSYAEAIRTGIYSSNLVTTSTITISGATGSVEAAVTYPLGIFVGGLGDTEPNGTMSNPWTLPGQSNTSIIVGQTPVGDAPDLPTAIGAPMWVYCSTAFDNENKITRIRDANEYTSPAISIYEPGDAAIPAWNDLSIPLEVRPSATGVTYIGTVDLETFEFYPYIPSIISDGSNQSLFFVASTDLYNQGHTAGNRTKFMLDTGAQVTVVGSTVAAILGLNPNNPEFWVEIKDVTGQTTMRPGFDIDTLEIPAIGQYYSATNVPVVYMDIDSPEGGFLDGIIGMNLFTGYNMVLRGGAFLDPSFLDLKLITNIADITPAGGDGKVDSLDLATIVTAWLSQPGDGNWGDVADIAPEGGDDIVNFEDFALMASNWGWLRGQ
jgi:hypothetical protein